MGLEGPGSGAIFGNPMFVNYTRGNEAADFALTAASPAIDRGTRLGYETDSRGTPIGTNALPDMGAFDYVPADGR